MLAHTSCNYLKKALITDGSASSFSTATIETRTPTTAGNVAGLLTTDGFHKISSGTNVESWIFVRPVNNANNATASLRVWGWSEELEVTAGVKWLVPTLLVQVLYTAGNINSVLNTDYYIADTVAITYGDASARLYSNAVDLPGGFAVDLLGSQYVYFDFAINSGTATGKLNALWRQGS